MRGDDWTCTTTPPPLASGEVHIWRLLLAADSDALALYSGLLSDDERQRAARFYFDRDRNRFIAAHGQVRQILAQYLAVDPAALSFAVGAHGKPYLAGHNLRFNLSHSHKLALLAVTRGRDLGVDVEFIKADFATDEVAHRFFSPHELAELAQVQTGQQALAFFDCWTRKEAYIKARGEGLAIPLDSFDVTLTPGAPARLLAVRDSADDAARWSIVALDAGPGYAAALMAEGTVGRVRCFEPEGK